MGDIIKISGKIVFDPKDKTAKHRNQATWKRVAMVVFDDADICEYYSWFINKRYNIFLNRPLRSGHITFINDKTEDINDKWDEVKQKWNGKSIDVVLDIDVRTNGLHWWLNIPHEFRQDLQNIRYELGLGYPYFGMHLTIGSARAGIHEEHSKYIHECISKGFVK
jgi:hypothetical protein